MVNRHILLDNTRKQMGQCGTAENRGLGLVNGLVECAIVCAHRNICTHYFLLLHDYRNRIL